MTDFWINKLVEGGIVAGSFAALMKSVNYFISRDKEKSIIEKNRAEAESIRMKTANEVLNNVMSQLADVRNENISQAKEMAELRLLHHKEMDEERRSCAQQMRLMYERIQLLEGKVKELSNNKN